MEPATSRRWLRLWHVAVPVGFAALPLLHSRLAGDAAQKRPGFSLGRPIRWVFGSFFSRTATAVRSYSAEVARSTWKDQSVTDSFAKMVETAVAQPEVGAAIEKRVDALLASPDFERKVTKFFMKVIQSDEIRRGLQDQLEDPELHERVGEALSAAVLRIAPWPARFLLRGQK